MSTQREDILFLNSAFQFLGYTFQDMHLIQKLYLSNREVANIYFQNVK